MEKKFFIGVLALVSLLLLGCSNEADNFRYVYDENNMTAIVDGFKDDVSPESMKIVTIPSTCKNEKDGKVYPVVAIGCYAFSECLELEKIILPNSIVQIQDYAFENCINLKEVVFQNKDNVDISGCAFRFCDQTIIYKNDNKTSSSYGSESYSAQSYNSSSNNSNHYDNSSNKWEEFAGKTYRASQWVSDRTQYYAFSYNRSGKGKYFIYCNYPGTNVVEDQMEFSIYNVESEGNYLYLYSHELNSPVKIEIQGSSLYTMNGDRYEIWR